MAGGAALSSSVSTTEGRDRQLSSAAAGDDRDGRARSAWASGGPCYLPAAGREWQSRHPKRAAKSILWPDQARWGPARLAAWGGMGGQRRVERGGAGGGGGRAANGVWG